MHSPTSKLAVLLTLPPTFLAVAHLWGTVYHQAMLESWGFDDSDFPLTTPQVYQYAFHAALTVVVRPFSWATEILGGYVWLVLAGLAALSVLWGWLTSQVSVVRWWRRFSNRAAARRRARRLPRMFRRAMEMFITLSCTAVLPLAVSFVLSVIAVVLVYPPILAGEAEARDVWTQQRYLTWRQVSWSDDKTGAAQTGALMRCTEKLCGIFQGDRSLLLAPSQIRYLPTVVSVARPRAVSAPEPAAGQVPDGVRTQ